MADSLENTNSSADHAASWNVPLGISHASTVDLWADRQPLHCSESADSYISRPKGKPHDRFKAKPEEVGSRISSLGNDNPLSPTAPNEPDATMGNFTIAPLMSPPLVVDQIAPGEDSSEDRTSPRNRTEGRSTVGIHLANECAGSIPSSHTDGLLDATESALQLEDNEEDAHGPKFQLPMASACVNDRSLSNLELGTYFGNNSPSKWSVSTKPLAQNDETGEPALLPPAFDPQFDFEDDQHHRKEPEGNIQWNTSLYSIARGVFLLGLLCSPMIWHQCCLVLPKSNSNVSNPVQRTREVDARTLSESDKAIRSPETINISEKPIHHLTSFPKAMVLRDTGRIKAFAPHPMKSYIQMSNLLTSYSLGELPSASQVYDVKRSMIGSWGRSMSKILLSVRLLLLQPFATPVYLATLSLYPWVTRIFRYLSNDRTKPPTTPMEAIL